MDRVERYLDQICRSIGGPRSLRDHVRQELREHLLDSRDRHRALGQSDDEALTSALEEFGRPEDVRLELEATHGQRLLAVVIDKAMQWKERTMRAKWLWSTWAYLTMGLVITLELLFIFSSCYFVYPKFRALTYDGIIDAELIRQGGGSWMLTFLERLSIVEQKYTLPILIAAAVAIGLFEWRVRGENKSLMRFAALGTAALGLFLVVIVMTFSLVVTFCLTTPQVIPMVRPWAVEQVASIGAALDGIEQARVKKDWDTLREQAELASSATESLTHGPAIISLVGRNSSPTWAELRSSVQGMTAKLPEIHKAIRDKDETTLSTSLRELQRTYEPLRDVSKGPPPRGPGQRRG